MLPGVSPSASAAPADPATLGTSASQAAGSCWEIKQVRPAAADGAYWLLTPAMKAPQQFYCDMTTDGGGWVLVGKGRNGWITDYNGIGRQSDLQSPDLATMSATTTQLPSTAVDALLNGQPVKSLTDGIRLRRATNVAGTSWQESRFTLAKRDRWAWTFGAVHPLGAWSFDGVNGSGGNTSSYGSDQSFRRVNNVPQTSQGFAQGFAFGSGVAGSSASTSYLWSKDNGGGAIPYTQVYLRPRVTSGDAGFAAIPDSGTAAQAQARVAANDALDSPWGVSGIAGSTAREGAVEVQAFTQSGNTMYVGGNFARVTQEGGTGAVNQPFLAAFDVTTGQWLSSFRPVLNEQVHALATLPSGEVVAGGDFTSSNGAVVAGVVALNPTTGANSTTWRVMPENRREIPSVSIYTLEVGGSHLYLGGIFTHLTGGTRVSAVAAWNMGRVSTSNGTTDNAWNPKLNGTVSSISYSPDGARVYASGFFSTSNGVAAKRVAALSTAAGAALVTPAWNPSWSSTSKDYQRSIKAVGNDVWVGGSEHSLFQFDAASFVRKAGYIMQPKGDIQAIDEDQGVLYAGCHCNNFSYENQFTWPSITPDWTQSDAMNWVGAWDASTGKMMPQFTATLLMRLGSGVWAIDTDTADNLWVGGDIVGARTQTRRSGFAAGFARFPMVDSTAPTLPGGLTSSNATATTVRLSWSAASDDRGGVTYQVLRDDRTIATTGQTSLTVPLGGDGRFFVRAVDAAGNVSASTPVRIVGAGVVRPTAAFSSTSTELEVDLDASGSTDSDGQVVGYAWDYGDTSTGNGRLSSHTYGAPGTYTVTLTVTDDQGNVSDPVTQEVVVTGAPVTSAVVERGSSWAWRYSSVAVPAGWNARTFDASGWSQGNGTLGFGSTPLGTNIDTFATTADRARAAYFTKSFTVPDATKVTRLVLTTVADDGVVVYVNGVEVARSNMPAGTITGQTYASSARNSTVANAAPVVVEVPTNLLVSGTNVIAAETHLNFRATRDMTFDLDAALTTQG
ncbi:PKD domain-containing protein [Nocardioides dongxiaopingii]|uniref:fibrinogen-like YCDxxxxGGGW domain-containing protein n=1 Tax=Nocardioides sp. S-1144 TaxID=2582905 RepID=UPI001163C61E|nr:fibrinogen-like YCDxxxxGGGW domain-containing protein [Nocardioides sp. S-1144]QCW51433.2 PKD domain-containing protein [Nocardioides sp. S-1144]